MNGCGFPSAYLLYRRGIQQMQLHGLPGPARRVTPPIKDTMQLRARPGARMSDELRLTIQVVISLMIIFGVLWWMWRLPGEAVEGSNAATTLSFSSVWLGVASIVVAVWLWWTDDPQFWAVTTVMMWAAALSTGLLALWTYRHTPIDRMAEEVLLQRLQARVGVGLGLVSIALWYAFMILRFSTLTVAPEAGEAMNALDTTRSAVAAEKSVDRTYHLVS